MEEYPPLITRPKTIICDIDGTIVKHAWPVDPTTIPNLLPGVRPVLKMANLRGHRIIFLTARTENFRDVTMRTINAHQLPCDLLIMGVPTGQRILINDIKPEESGLPTAIAINLNRDEGFVGIEL